MKKTYFLAVMALVGMLAVTGCEINDNGSDDGSVNDDTASTNSPVVSQGQPTITIYHIPVLGKEDYLSGKISGVDVTKYTVIPYLKISNTWVKKPGADIEVAIKSNGGWSTWVSSEPADLNAKLIHVFMALKTFDTPATFDNVPENMKNLVSIYVTR